MVTPQFSSPLRIIQVVNVRWFNATAWYALYLSQLLQKAGHRVEVIALEGTETFEKAHSMGLAPRHIPLNAANPFALAQAYRTMGNLVKSFQPHIVNCHRGEGFLLWALLKRAYPFALVRTRGDQRPPKANLPNKILHAHLADALIATNSVTAGDFENLLHCPPSRIHCIFGGVDTETFRFDQTGRQRVREEFGFTDEHTVISLLGRFDWVKGQKELLQAFASIVHPKDAEKAQQPWRSRLRLLLMGFGTAVPQSTVEGWIQEYALGAYVSITGKRPDIAACISATDIAVLASLGSETIARAAFEFMSCGIPLLSTRVGVMPDLLPDWALVPPADVPALAAGIEQCVTDTTFRTLLREAGLCTISALSGQDFLTHTLHAYAGAMAHAGRTKE